MGPSPPHQPVENGHVEIDLETKHVREYEVEGWRIGFEVEIHGVGEIRTVREENTLDGEIMQSQRMGDRSEDESSGWESDPSSDNESQQPNVDSIDLRYAGYQSLSTDPSSAAVIDTYVGDVFENECEESLQNVNQCQQETVGEISISPEVENSVDADISLALGAVMHDHPIESRSFSSLHGHVLPNIKAEFERLIIEKPSSSLDEPITFEPKSIELDESKISEIRRAMSHFKLSPPSSWNEHLLQDDDLKKILEKIGI